MLNQRRFPIGSVVYFIGAYVHNSYNAECVRYGVVSGHYTDATIVQLYEPRDMRRIDGVPIKEFETPTKWRKLPKGWSYDTKLFDLTFDEFPKEKSYEINNPQDILDAIADGVLVKVQDNDHSEIRTEIDKTEGWRICRDYPYGSHYPEYIGLQEYQMYETYQEAEAVIKKHDEELKRIAELSDYDWSVEQIDNTLGRWAHMTSDSDKLKYKYREWLLNLDRVEDIETRISGGSIQ